MSNAFTSATLVATVLLSSCGGTVAPPVEAAPAGDATSLVPAAPPSPWQDEVARGVDDPALASLLAAHWEAAMRDDPEWSTRLGDHRYDDRLTDYSADGYAARLSSVRRALAAAREIDADGLGEQDRVTLGLLTERLAAEEGIAVCAFERWNVSSRNNPLSELNELPELAPIETAGDRENLAARYRAVPGAIRAMAENLAGGARDGLFTNRRSIERVIEMIEAQLAEPTDAWALLALGDDVEPAFRARLLAIVDEEVRPALVEFVTLLREVLLPGARDGDRIGVSALGPNGAACYDAAIREHTSRVTSAETLHQLGLDEVRRINDEMRALGHRLFRTRDLASTLARLRADESLYFRTEEEVEAAAREALADATARVPEYFASLPRTPCVVTRIPDYEAPFTTVAYYRPPSGDGSAPGEYFINTSSPTTRPRYQARALAFHESVPGHHLQIATALELEAVPLFRRHTYVTVYTEGWGLYTERLADEMGLYESDLDRMGMLSYDAWRASRLVVDTGIHAMGWDRARAERFMTEHTALTAGNIENEVDRYIVWPGQALAYKVGQLEIRRLRALAEAELGERFDLPAFHDVVLRGGAVTMTVLEDEVRAWIARTLAEE